MTFVPDTDEHTPIGSVKRYAFRAESVNWMRRCLTGIGFGSFSWGEDGLMRRAAAILFTPLRGPGEGTTTDAAATITGRRSWAITGIYEIQMIIAPSRSGRPG